MKISVIYHRSVFFADDNYPKMEAFFLDPSFAASSPPMTESKRKRKKQKDCSRCSRKHGEVFRCYRKSFEFDVDLARELTSDGRDCLELDADDIAYSIDRCEINEAHIDHVNPSIPGIVSHVFFPDDEGRVHHAHRLIDGHHRAAYCLREGIPFFVYVLTESESVSILRRAPEGARPEPVMEQNLN